MIQSSLTRDQVRPPLSHRTEGGLPLDEEIAAEGTDEKSTSTHISHRDHRGPHHEAGRAIILGSYVA